MDKQKLIERVRKLYAMSQDTSSPKEAAIAARRARVLMDQEGITLKDIKQEQHEFGAHNSNYGKRFPKWINYMSVQVAKLNDCIGRLERDELTGVTDIVFQGFDVDALSATLMLDYLVETGARNWKAHLKENRELVNAEGMHAARESFRIGFARAIVERLKEMNDQREANKPASDGRSLVVIKAALVADHYGAAYYSSASERRGKSANAGAGYAAGQRAGLNSQVNSNRPRGALQ